MCIYYGNKEGLTYSGEEHIIPAAIGGSKKLPQGYVSDQFNSKISLVEQHLFRDGLISTPRIFVGPGKRGSLAPSRATVSKVHLISSPSNPDIFALGYTKLGKTYEIPHLAGNTNTGTCTFSIDKTDQSDAIKILNSFKEKCENATSLKIKVLECSQLPENILLIGIKDGIEENYNCFVAKNNKWQVSPEAIQNIGKNIHFNQDNLTNIKYQPQGHQTIKFEEDHLRVYGKIAFNFLALVLGKEEVCHERFDEVRSWITDNCNYNGVALRDNRNPLVQTGILFPNDAHVIYLNKIDGELRAHIFLYESMSVEVLLCKQYDQRFDLNGFICDWRNKNEYLLHEFLTQNIPRQ